MMGAARTKSLGGRVNRNPEIGGSRRAIPRWHYADHRIDFAVEFDGAADGTELPAKILPPESVAEDGNVIAAGLVLAVEECTAPERLHAKHVKKIGLYLHSLRALGFAGDADVIARLIRINRHILKCAVLGAPIQIILAR